jgi:hypothetical protein
MRRRASQDLLIAVLVCLLCPLAAVPAAAQNGNATGQVTNESGGAPLSGYSVFFYSSTGSFVSSAQSGVDGIYNISLAPGSYFARTGVSSSQNFVDELYNNIVCVPSCVVTTGTPIVVTAGATTTGIDFALTPGGSIAGMVTDNAATPLASVSVQVSTANGVFVRSASTNASGLYTVGGLPAGSYVARTFVQSTQNFVDELYNNISCSPSCTLTTGTPIVVATGSITGGIDFALAPAGAISGVVTDALMLPLASVNVRVYNSAGSQVKSVTTDASGVWTAVGLGTGSYFARTFVSSSLNYIDELYNNMTCVPSCGVTTGTAIAVTVGTTTNGINFSLATGGAITGTVSDASTAAGITGVSVSIYTTSGTFVKSTTSNASGLYTVVGLPTGSYVARTFVPSSANYLDELYNDLPCPGNCSVASGTPIAVTAGAATSAINFTLSPGGSIAGTVTDAGSAAPLTNVTVQVYSASGSFVKSASSNASGEYAVGGLAAGSYFARTSLSSSANFVNEIYDNVLCIGGCTVTAGTAIAVTLGNVTGGINFALSAGGTLTGTITDAGSAAPLANINVDVYTAVGTFVKSASSNASGIYTVAGLPSGSYVARTFVQSSVNYLNELFDNILCVPTCTVTTGTPIPVTLGNVTGGIDFALSPGGRIAGMVTDSVSGLPISNVEVEVYSPAGTFQRSAFTDATGAYTVGQLTTGSYVARTFAPFPVTYLDELHNNIVCVPNCDVTTGTPIAVTAGSPTAIDFTLTPGGSISGTITVAGAGTPIGGVSVQVYNTSGTQIRTATTDASGTYTVGGLPGGTYFARTQVGTLNYIDELHTDLVCVPNCTVTNGTPIVVAVGATTGGINFALAAGGSITGMVTEAVSGTPIGSVTVQVFSSFGTFVRSATTNASGVFTVAGLPAGSYFSRTSLSSSLNYLNELYNNINCAVSCSVTSGTPIAVTAGVPTGGINFTLSIAGSIGGMVTGGGTPLESATVQVYQNNGTFVKNAFTDAAGAYTVVGLATGSYLVRTSVSTNYINEVHSNIPCLGCLPTIGNLVSVTAGATTGNINFALDAGGSIAGTVTEAGSGLPLGQMTLTVFTSAGRTIRSVGVNDDGTFSFLGLPSGNYFVRTANGASQGYGDELYDNFAFATGEVTLGTPIPVTLGNTTAGIDIVLSPAATLTGTVTDANTLLPLSNVNVRLYDASTGLLARNSFTNAAGEFVISNLTPGTYYASTSNTSGYINGLYNGQPCLGSCQGGTPIVVASGASITGIDFALIAGGRITGVVTYLDSGTPLAGITVRLYTSTGVNVAQGITDGTGTFTTTAGVPTGTYYARTFNNFGYIDEIFDNQTLCLPNCLVTSGTAIFVTTGATTLNINFALSFGTELIQNGTFSNGVTNWLLFATPSISYMEWQATGSTFQFSRVPPPPGTGNQAVIFQNTGADLPANAPIVAQFDLSNTSTSRKRISVLIHEGDFSDLSVCTFWLPPSMSTTRYGIRTRTTKAWTNATISFYAASTNNPSGFYTIDNVSMQSPPAAVVERTDCLDPNVAPSTGGADGANLLQNGDFSTGALLPGWGTFGQIQWQVAGGVFEFLKLAGTPSGVLLQPTGQPIPANTLLSATFQLGNSSGVRKRVTVIVHDNNFSDLSACTFWLSPGQPLSTYMYRAYTTKAWTNATFSIYPATTGLDQWIRFDNATLRTSPGAPIAGAECIEPGGADDGGAALPVSAYEATIARAVRDRLRRSHAWD